MKHRKRKEDRKEISIRVRLTAEQKGLLAKAARRDGLDLSAWLRFVAIKEANEKQSKLG